MFGLFDLFVKRVSDQIAEYATTQSDIARRLWGNWLDPFHACRPGKINVDRHVLGGTTARNTKPRR